MIEVVPPAVLYIAAALLFPLFRRARPFRETFLLLVPLLAFWDLLQMTPGNHWTYSFLGYDLIFGRVDKLSMVFGYIFVIMSFLGFLYAIHVKEDGQHVAALLYVGSSLGVVFAGDLFSLFVFWEMMAASAVFLVWYRREKSALNAGFRYLLVHLFGGAMLLAGIVMQVFETGSTAFGAMNLENTASKFILFGFLLNAAVPPLHAWLADAYPEGTVSGSVFMTAFTTKSGVYVLARSFAGTELLVWLGAIMAVYGVIYAVLENDIRRLLAYHIISQVGYMVCGIGLGSEMSINGTSAHAFCHILYKALLFMGTGAVIYVTGRRKLTELQGRNLYRMMPITFGLYMVGAFSISAVPLFNGFVSKNMVVYSAGLLNRPVIELMLHLASIGTFLHTGLKLPWGTWFGKSTGHEDKVEATEPPFNMLLAMGVTAFLCILTGVYPQLLYAILPYPVDFHPYTPDKVVAMFQLLLLTGVAFWLYIDKLAGEPTLSLDTDWFYRMFGKSLAWFCNEPLNGIRSGIQNSISQGVLRISHLGNNPYRVPKLIYFFLRGDVGEKYQVILSENFHVNTYKMSIGIAVATSVLFLFFFGLIYIIVGG